MFHFIQEGDTIEHLATALGIENPKHLKAYNNRTCLPEDLIDAVLIPGRKISIPTLPEIERFNALNDAGFKSAAANPDLSWKSFKWKEQYEVGINYPLPSGASSTLQYRIRIEWYRSEHLHHYYKIYKTHTRLNTESKMSNLAIAVIEAINPLMVMLDQEGRLFKIKMSPEAGLNWPDERAKLLDLFPDPYAAQYIESFEYGLGQADFFDKRMKQDLFIRHYFAPFRSAFHKGQSGFKLPAAKGAELQISQQVKPGEDPEFIQLEQFSHIPGQYEAQLDLAVATNVIDSMHIRLGSETAEAFTTLDINRIK